MVEAAVMLLLMLKTLVGSAQSPTTA